YTERAWVLDSISPSTGRRRCKQNISAPRDILDIVSPFRRLLSYVLRYRRAFVLGLLCVLITQGVALASPMVLRYAIDDLTRSVTRAKLFEYAVLLFGIGVGGGLFRFLMRRI